ncbi:CBS domain-containing protein [Candidatus Bathyarchaeota archaeon]|nr:CBS domain-containing protein [Candidatus Bathyarchaeota archaeon]
MTDSSVNKIMTRKVVTVRPDITINQLLDIMTHHMGYPVVNSLNELISVITFEDVSRIPKEKRDEIFVGEIANKNLVVVHPRDSILEAFEKMNLYNIGRILVVDPENPKKLVGIITRTNILKALIKH